MFADIYPIKRLPRRFGAFTYVVSDEQISKISRGCFVTIPWRSGLVWGVVARVHDKATEAKSVLEVLPTWLLSDELDVYEQIAEETFQSVSSVLHAAFPATRRREPVSTSAQKKLLEETFSACVNPSELIRLEELAKSLSPVSFVQTHDLIDIALLVRFLAKHRPGPILFLVPHEHDLHVVSELLSLWKLPLSLCTSALTQPKRHDLSLAWRNGEIPLLLSTRLGSLFPPPQNLSAIVIGRSGVNEHAQYDRNPRYDSRRIAQAWSTLRVCPLLLCDTLARCVDLAITTPSPSLKRRGIAKPAASRGTTTGASGDSLRSGTNLESLRFQISSPIAATDPETQPWRHEIVDTGVSVRYGEDPLLSESLSSHINKTLKDGGRVLLICNQKGLGARMECRDCKFIEICASCQKPLAVYETHLSCVTCKRVTARPERCRKCKSALKTVRRGTKSLEKLLKERWPDASVEIIEKGGHAPSHDASLLITTSYYYEALYRPHADRFGLVALPCADQEVRLEADLSCAARRLIEYQGIAKRNRCPFLLQTWDTKLFHRLLHDTNAILKEECRARQEFGQAPFAQELELFGRGTGGFRELDRVLTLARAASETTVTKLTPARWKILTKSAKLQRELQKADDSLVIANKTFL